MPAKSKKGTVDRHEAPLPKQLQPVFRYRQRNSSRHTRVLLTRFLERFSGHQRQFLLHASSIIEVARAGHIQ